jgi:hypothetical protein
MPPATRRRIQKAWTLRDFPPEWWCKEEKVLVNSKQIRYARPCADCKTASKKRKSKKESKRKEKEERIKGAEGDRESTPTELKKRYTIGAVARHSLVLSRLRKLMKMRAAADEVQAPPVKPFETWRVQGKAWA